jgi:hypothetical protein
MACEKAIAGCGDRTPQRVRTMSFFDERYRTASTVHQSDVRWWLAVCEQKPRIAGLFLLVPAAGTGGRAAELGRAGSAE